MTMAGEYAIILMYSKFARCPKGVRLLGKDLKGKELGSGLSQRNNGSYCGRYFDRTGKRRSIYNKDLRELKRELNKAIYESENGIAIVDEKTTLDEWFNKWLFIYKNDIIRENTKRHYVQVYKLQIAPALGEIPISKITKLQCQQLMGKLKERGYGWSTINKVKIMLNDMFERALDDSFIRKNPIKGIRLPMNRPNERRVLTVEEQALFFNCSSGTFYNNLFVVAINTGLRPGELFALTWNDIDLERKEINITKTLVYQKYLDDECKTFHLEDPKTKLSERVVPINSECEVALKRQYIQKHIVQARCVSGRVKEDVPFRDRLFVTKFNTPLNSVIYGDAIKRIVAEVNLMLDDMEQMELFSGHTFRHTFATRCIESGIKPKVLQAYLGHASLQMTMDLYVHNTEEHKRSEMGKLERAAEKISITEESIDKNYRKCLDDDNTIISMNRFA